MVFLVKALENMWGVGTVKDPINLVKEFFYRLSDATNHFLNFFRSFS